MALQSVTPTHPWHVPRHTTLERDELVVALDPERPNWIATDARGARILGWLDGRRSLDEVAALYAQELKVDHAKAAWHVGRFVRSAERHGFAAPTPLTPARYTGRSDHLTPRLRELWVHTNNSCNLACEHCLVSSSPAGDKGMSRERLLALVDEAASLGARRFYFTGGEPFLRPDIFELIERVTSEPERELHVLTNGLLFEGAVLDRLRAQNPERLRLQVSLDGASPATNDPTRGPGTFDRIVRGVRTLVAEGFAPTLSTVISTENVAEMTSMVRLVAELGASSWHALWIHKKGRSADLNGSFASPARIEAELRKARAEAERLGVTIDNLVAFRERVNGAPGSRVDLSNAAIESVCVYSDGRVYPSAATVQYRALSLGWWSGGDLDMLLSESETARQFQGLSVAHKPVCNTCDFRFICGGGDVEHAYSYGLGVVPTPGTGAFDHLDPYCDLYKGLITDSVFELAAEGRRRLRGGTGYDAPVVYHAMGEGNLACAPGGDVEAYAPVRTSHSNCVVPRGLDTARSLVRDFYARAAATPQEALCCPVGYDADDVAHVPQDVLDRFYGCGGPMAVAGAKAGETVVDLGSGAGIDVFIAAKKVGAQGRAIGIDMTDPMLGVAAQSSGEVARRLGYDVVEFKKGFLESVPLDDDSADLLTSNCVINLSPDKPAVFAEMWRVLKDHGRIVISDIVAEGDLPPDLKVNVHMWGECISGALSQDEFVAQLERAGFYGVQVLQKRFWKEVEGYRFYSVTVRGYKFEKKQGCVFAGHRAVYLGPYTSVSDEEGHLFPRDQPVEVCTDTVAKLQHPPYLGAFAILEPGVDVPQELAACGPECC